MAVGWTAWIGWCGRSSGSVVKMAFVQGISAKDEVLSRISMQVRGRKHTQGARPGGGSKEIDS